VEVFNVWLTLSLTFKTAG